MVPCRDAGPTLRSADKSTQEEAVAAFIAANRSEREMHDPMLLGGKLEYPDLMDRAASEGASAGEEFVHGSWVCNGSISKLSGNREGTTDTT